MSFLSNEAKLFKVIHNMWGIDRASHSKKNGVKDDFLGLQVLTKNLEHKPISIMPRLAGV